MKKKSKPGKKEKSGRSQKISRKRGGGGGKSSCVIGCQEGQRRQYDGPSVLGNFKKTTRGIKN